MYYKENKSKPKNEKKLLLNFIKTIQIYYRKN